MSKIPSASSRNRKPLTQSELRGFWGDGGPYSEVHVDKEIRILDDYVSRSFYYVTANLNPTTYRLLKRAKGLSAEIQDVLGHAELVDDAHGYLLFFGRVEADEEVKLQALEDHAVSILIALHRLIIEMGH